MFIKISLMANQDNMNLWYSKEIHRGMTLAMTLLMKKGMCLIKYYVEDDKY